MRASSPHRVVRSSRVAVLAATAWLALAALGSAGAEAQASPAAPPGYESASPAQSAPPPTLPQTTSTPPPSYGYGDVAPTYPGATYAPYGPVAPPPTRARRVEVERTESIRGLWLPGLIVLPIAWVTTWTISTSAFYGDAATFSWIPVIGPWLMLTQDLNGNEAGIVVSGVVQGLASLAILLGLTIQRTYTDYEYVIEPAPGARLRLDAISLPGGGMIGASLEM